MRNVKRPRFRTELDPAEELDLIRRAQAGDQQAYARLLAANEAYVSKQARPYRGCGLDLEDLEEEARRGLSEAVERFNPAAGVRLITYAKFWVQNRLRDAALAHGRMIRIPRLVHQGIARSYKAGEDLDAASLVAGGYVVNEEIAKAASVLWGERPRSLDAKGSDGQGPLRDRLRDEAPSPEAMAIAAEMGTRGLDLVEELVDTLPASEADVIRRRYFAETPETLQEIADGRGRTRQRIDQIEKSALDRLRARVANRISAIE